jgi:purine-binding chemotaxis protein CheW
MHVMIIVKIGEQLVGLLADRVSDIVSVDTANVQPVPRTGGTTRTEFLSGLVTVDDAMIALIDLPHLFETHFARAAAA